MRFLAVILGAFDCLMLTALFAGLWWVFILALINLAMCVQVFRRKLRFVRLSFFINAFPLSLFFLYLIITEQSARTDNNLALGVLYFLSHALLAKGHLRWMKKRQGLSDEPVKHLRLNQPERAAVEKSLPDDGGKTSTWESAQAEDAGRPEIVLAERAWFGEKAPGQKSFAPTAAPDAGAFEDSGGSEDHQPKSEALAEEAVKDFETAGLPNQTDEKNDLNQTKEADGHPEGDRPPGFFDTMPPAGADEAPKGYQPPVSDFSSDPGQVQFFDQLRYSLAALFTKYGYQLKPEAEEVVSYFSLAALSVFHRRRPQNSGRELKLDSLIERLTPKQEALASSQARLKFDRLFVRVDKMIDRDLTEVESHLAKGGSVEELADKRIWASAWRHLYHSATDPLASNTGASGWGLNRSDSVYHDFKVWMNNLMGQP